MNFDADNVKNITNGNNFIVFCKRFFFSFDYENGKIKNKFISVRQLPLTTSKTDRLKQTYEVFVLNRKCTGKIILNSIGLESMQNF